MKCMNCGKNDVNFYYTSNINGKITKQQLCSECAEKLGYTQNVGSMFRGTEKMFNSMLGDFFGRGLSPFTGFGLEAPEFMRLPWLEEPTSDRQCSCGCDCTEHAKPAEKETVDPVLNRRREINALRHQMKEAARTEDFEKAAQLRDRLHKLESEE